MEECTPSPMIFPSILGLEMLCWETRITIALPDTIREKPFQWDLFDSSAMISSSSVAFATAFEHGVGRCDGAET